MFEDVFFVAYRYERKPVFARSCRSAQSGNPTAPREVRLPLLPHEPGGVRRHLPRRTRLRRSAGPDENRPVPFDSLSAISLRNEAIVLLFAHFVKHFFLRTSHWNAHSMLWGAIKDIFRSANRIVPSH